MSLRERLSVAGDGRHGAPGMTGTVGTVSIGGAPGTPSLAAAAYQDLKKSMHHMIMERIDLERLQRLTPEQFKHELALLVQRIIEEERIVLNLSLIHI